MAVRKRLTREDGNQVDMDIDHVAYMQRTDNRTTRLFLAGALVDRGAVLLVRETPDQIHSAALIPSRD